MGGSLRDKTAKGISWGFIDNILSSGITAAATIVLARLLTDRDFGIIGMTSIFITLSTSLVDSGFHGALVRKKEATEADKNTVFYFNLVLSLLLYSVLFAAAPHIASFFGVEILAKVIRILGFSLIINALSIVHKVILVRKMDFRTQAVISTVSSVVSGVLAIVAAAAGYGLWSLVAMQLSKLFVYMFMLWFFTKWRPALLFSVSSFREMFSFGGRLLVTSIISTLWNEMYSFIIGKIYSASMLGQFSRADKVKNMVTSNVSMVMQRVSYPVLASIQDESERQKQVYRKILKTTMLISFTAVFGIWAVAEPFTVTVFGSQWLPSVEYLRILCLSGIFLPLMICSANVINADGRSDLTLVLEIIKTLMAVIPVVFGIFFSIEALLWSMVGVYAILYVIHGLFVSKILGYGLFEQIKDIFPSFVVAVVMAFTVNLFNYAEMQYWLRLLLQVFTGCVTVVVIYEFIYRNEEYADIRNELLKNISGYGRKRKDIGNNSQL